MRGIQWNPEHKNSDDQQNAFIDEYLTWPAAKKWEYLMELVSQGLKGSTKKGNRDGTRRIEWDPTINKNSPSDLH